MKVLVTGASGFVGRQLCDQLLKEGHQVTGLFREEQDTGNHRSGFRVARGTLSDPGSLSRACVGIEGVVHLAARVHVMRERRPDPYAAFRAVNVTGTALLVEAARQAGCRRFVFMSTAKVHGEGQSTPYRESSVPAPADAYARSKLEAEQVVSASGLDWTILRPPLVYGPRVGGNFLRLLRLADLATRWPLPLQGIDNLRSMIFSGNLVNAVECVLRSRAAVHGTYLVSDAHDTGFSALLVRLVRAMNRVPRLWAISPHVFAAFGSLLGRGADIQRMLGTFQVDPGLIMQQLGWAPAFGLDAAIESTVSWWLEQKGVRA